MTAKKKAPIHVRRKIRRGRFGDVRLLALSFGILLLSVLSLVLRANSSDEVETGDSAAARAVIAHQAPSEPAAEGWGDAPFVVDAVLPADAPTPPSPQERERILDDMAEGMPEGAVIIF